MTTIQEMQQMALCFLTIEGVSRYADPLQIDLNVVLHRWMARVMQMTTAECALLLYSLTRSILTWGVQGSGQRPCLPLDIPRMKASIGCSQLWVLVVGQMSNSWARWSITLQEYKDGEGLPRKDAQWAGDADAKPVKWQ